MLIILLGACLFSVAAPSTALGQDSDEFEEGGRSYSSVVVQNRRFNPDHEFTALLGLLPLDAFTKGLTVGGAYTLHFNELVAWEVVQFNYSFHYDTSLKADLETFDLKATPFEVLNYYASSNLVFKPVYWKGSLLNSGLIRGELYTVLGGAFGSFTRSDRAGVDGGGGVRLFTSDLVSFRLDMRYYMFFNDTILDNFSFEDELAINLGTSIAF
jgi:outer membrane beta-barrel protein